MAFLNKVKYSELSEDLRLDSEYYKADHIKIDSILAKHNSLAWGKLNGEFIVGPFGSAFHVENYVDFSPYRYIRGRDVKPFFLLDDENCYIPEKDFMRLKKYSLNSGDLLISVVGTVGNVSIVTEDIGKSIFSCKSTAYRSNSLDPYYICAYFNSKIGQNYMLRLTRGHVQTGVNLNDLKSIPIYIPSERLEAKIVPIVQKSYSLFQRSKTLYEKAQKQLLEDLGISNLNYSQNLYYQQKFSEVEQSSRLDAEFYQPKYYSLLGSLKAAAEKRKSGYISDLSQPLKYGTSDKLTYVNEGTPFLRIADLEHKRFSFEKALKIPEYEASLQTGARVQTGDVLVSRSGTLGIAVPIPSKLDNAVFGSYFIRIRPDKDIINPEYLALFINSLCGSLQTERLFTGGIQMNLTIPAIENILIIYEDLIWQDKFVGLVEKSISSRKEAYQLLNSAKLLIESTVLGNKK